VDDQTFKKGIIVQEPLLNFITDSSGSMDSVDIDVTSLHQSGRSIFSSKIDMASALESFAFQDQAIQQLEQDIKM